MTFGLLNAGIEEMGYYPLWPLQLILDLIRDLGIASLVGGFVSLGIEKISRERFQNEIAAEIKNIERSVINSAYRKRYPLGYTELVDEMLGMYEYFKYTLNVIVDLTIPLNPLRDNNNEEVINYAQTVSYWIHNMSNSDQQYQPRLFVDNNIPGFSPLIAEWSIGADKLDKKDIAALNKDHTCHNDQNWYQFPRKIILAPDQKLYVHSKIRSFRYGRDVTTWCGRIPADSMRFTINHPPSLTVYAQPKSLGRSQDMPYISDGERVTVEIFTPVLPFTTIELGWKRALKSDVAEPKMIVGTALPIEGSEPTSIS